MVDVPARWSRWLKGKRYDVRAVTADASATLKISQFTIRVQIRDNQTGEVFDRKGSGRVEGTNRPTYVHFKNKRRLLKEVLEMDEPPTVWTEWLEGKTYDVRIVKSDLIASPAKFCVRVEIRDKAGKVTSRMGHATYINNTSFPTYVSFKGKKLYINQLLELEE
jgi:hypothetical protein